MGEIKQTNFRINNETANNFRAFCEEQGFNQAQGFDYIMDILALNKAKEEIGGRMIEIEEFERHTKALISSYLSSINLANETEERVYANFKSKLESKDEQILKLQQDLKKQEEAITISKANREEYLNGKREMEEKVKDMSEKLKAAKKIAEDKEKINLILNEENIKLKAQLAEYDSLKESESTSKKKIIELEQTLILSELKMEKEKNAEIQALRDKIDNLKDENTLLKMEIAKKTK